MFGAAALVLAVPSFAVLTTPGWTCGVRFDGARRGPSTPSKTVWLCRPGKHPTRAPQTVEHHRHRCWGRRGDRLLDLAIGEQIRLLLRVSDGVVRTGRNADLTVQPAETPPPMRQASRFSQVCRVWAPMYRQAHRRRWTGELLDSAVPLAYDSLLSAWKDYLAHDNHGRPIVFIGHSQGSAMLIRLLRQQVDPSSKLRKRLVSAILLGGNVQVPSAQ